MDKSTRRDLIKKLYRDRTAKSSITPTNKTVTNTKKNESANYIAFIEPTEVDLLDELSRLIGFGEKKESQI